MLGENRMGTIFIIIGLFCVYLSETLWVIMYAKSEKNKMRWLDYIVCCIPVLRTIYLLVEVEENGNDHK